MNRTERYRASEKGRATTRAYQRGYSRTPQHKAARSARYQRPEAKFAAQRQQARQRGIAWLLTFEEWWAIWKDSWLMRGRGAEKLCMARRGDVGPYAIGNVELLTNRENLQQARRAQLHAVSA